ncbi:MAG TPA: hypothetical protein VLZ83_11335 [Edaphocola sp.]|nr:hypothetical protein [Edaphocola sp.]
MILDYLNKTFNNREIALISYLMIFIVWVLTQKKLRLSIASVVKAFTAWRILVLIFALLLYISFIVLGLFKMRLWDKYLIKDTVYWTFGVGFIILMNYDKAFKEEHYFKDLIKENFKVLLILEFIVGLYVFGIITEFILMPFVILFSVLLGYTQVYKEHEEVHKFINGIFVILGTVYIIYSGYHIYSDFTEFATAENLKILLFPIIMSVLFLPFAYSFALLVHYESLFARIDSFVKDSKLRRFAKLRIFLSVNFSIIKLKKITPGFLFNGCSTKEDIMNEINFKLNPEPNNR